MKQSVATLVFIAAASVAAACGADDDNAATTGGAGGTGGKGGQSGKGGKGGTGGTAGKGGDDAGGAAGRGASAGSGNAGRGGTGGTGGTSAGDAGDGGREAAGTAGETTGGAAGEAAQGGMGGEPVAGPGGGNGTTCTAARDTLLGPIDAVSAGPVAILSDDDGVRVLFVDATAGGYTMQTTNPWTYVRLSDGSRVDVTDLGGNASVAWDLALKRDIIRVNSGDSGPGIGASARVEGEAFEDVDASGAATATFAPDEFLDDQCEATLDETGKPMTGFSSWYDYDTDTMVLTPKPLVFLVRSADGSMTYKLELESYYSTPEGDEGPTSARYRLHYAAL